MDYNKIQDFICNAELGLFTKNEIVDMKEQLSEYVDELNQEVVSHELELQELGLQEQYTDSDEEYSGKVEDLQNNIQVSIQKRGTFANLLTRIEDILKDYRNFDKIRCFSNIRALLKINPDVKIGQIEKEANVRLGYVSRLEKPDNTSEPTVEFVVSAAKMFNVSVDYLLNARLNELTPNEEYLLKFVDNIISDTREGTLCWKRETAERLNTPLDYDNETGRFHPLFSIDENYVDPMGDAHLSRFISLFFPEKAVDVTSNVYNTELPGTDSVLYIVPCAIYPESDANGEAQRSCEMYIVKGLTINPLCSTLLTCDIVSEKLRDLYKVVREAASRVQLNDQTRYIMNTYLNIKKKIDDEPPFEVSSDDDLPFK